MEKLIEFFGSEDALTFVIAVLFIVIMSVLIIYYNVKVAINRKCRAANDKEIRRLKRAEKRKVLEEKAFDFAITYCSIENEYSDETTVVYKEVFV